MMISTLRLFGPTYPCIPDGTGIVGSGTQWPVGVSLETALKWYWRVKRWQAVSDLIYTPLVGDPTHYTGTSVPFGRTDNDNEPFADETQIICSDTQMQLSGSFTEGFFGDNLDLWSIANWMGVQVYQSAGLYWLRMQYSSIPLGTHDAGALAVADAKLYIDGVEVDLYCDDLVTITGSIVVSPYEYWPHDPGDGGGPVWDSATGALLRPEAIQPGFTW
jgi:hypothetical protein